MRMKLHTHDAPIVVITKHAFDKAAERMRMDAKTLATKATQAFISGLRKSDLRRGKLFIYLTRIQQKSSVVNNVRIYDDIVFLFENSILITVYPLQEHLKPLVRLHTGLRVHT